MTSTLEVQGPCSRYNSSQLLDQKTLKDYTQNSLEESNSLCLFMHMHLFMLFLLPPSLYFPNINKKLLLNCKKKKIILDFVMSWIIPYQSLSTNPQYLKMWLHLEVGHLRRWLSQSAASIVAPNLIYLVFLEEKRMWSHERKHQGCMCTDKEEYEDIRKSGYLAVKEKCLRRNEPCLHLDLEHWENKFLIFKPPILYFFFFLSHCWKAHTSFVGHIKIQP